MGEGRNHYFTLVSPYALPFVGTNFSLKCMRRIVLELIFISCKCKSIVTILHSHWYKDYHIDREQIRVNFFLFANAEKNFFHDRWNTYFIYVCIFQLRLSELSLNRSRNIETNCSFNEWIRFGFIFFSRFVVDVLKILPRIEATRPVN